MDDDDMLVTPMKPAVAFNNANNTRHVNNVGASSAANTTNTTVTEGTKAATKNKDAGVARRLKLEVSTTSKNAGKVTRTKKPTGIPPPTSTSSLKQQPVPTKKKAAARPPSKANSGPGIHCLNSPPDSLLRAADKALQTKQGQKSQHVAPALNEEGVPPPSLTKDDGPPTLIKEDNLGSTPASTTMASPPDSVLRAADQALNTRPPMDKVREESANQTTVILSPPPSKKDKLRLMRQVADTPPAKQEKNKIEEDLVVTIQNEEKEASSPMNSNGGSNNSSSMHLRLVRELKQAKEETARALRDVTRLESELAEEKVTKSTTKATPNFYNGGSKNNTEDILETVLELAKRNGEKAAVKWAEEAVRTSNKQPKMGGVNSGLIFTPTQNRIRPSFADAAMSSGLSSPPAISILAGGGSAIGSNGKSSTQKTSPSPAPVRNRRSTPFPKRRTAKVKLGLDFAREDADLGVAANNDNEEEEMEFLIAAARAIPDEYNSELASYFVRRPYLSPEEEVSGAQEENGLLWDQYGVVSAAEYADGARVSQPESLEVVATVEADGSVLVLHGMSSVRRGTPRWGTQNGDGQPTFGWVDIHDVVDGSLGCAYYVERDGTEKEYLLDQIFGEALSTRESYCASLLSAAAALKALPFSRNIPDQSPPLNRGNASVGNQAASQPPQPQMFIPEKTQAFPPMQPHRPELNNANIPPMAPIPQKNVGFEDKAAETGAKMESPPAVKPEVKKDAPPSDVGKKVNSKPLPPPPELVEAPNANDILVSMITFIISTLLRIVWFFVVRLPFKIFSWAVTVFLVSAVLLIIRLSIADDSGASSLGAGIDFGFNHQGIF